ncbi:MAG TPA: branched-chain amino acid ABC transporter permease [Streptosporangiaceae bacterium]|nr:branched-chain amino acid ABC transporter permease [Streptosporangiaceae bacterium]
MSLFFVGVGSGLVTAAIIALSTVGMSLQYSVTRTINFAHGELMTIGAYAAYVVARHTSNVLLQGAAAVAVGGALAWAFNRLLFRPFTRRGAGALTLFVLTIAASLIVQNVLEAIFSGNFVNYPSSASAAYRVGPFRWTLTDILTMAAAVVALLALHFTIRRTKFGKAQRAVADDMTLARTTGVRARQIVDLTWVIDGGVAGLSGMLLALQVGSFTPSLGFTFLLVIFSAAIVGGIGQMYGAMAGALIVGVVMEVSAVYIPPDYKETMAFLILIVVLLLRPQGIVAALSERTVR